ncbi:hypothetical protein DPMN_056668 [Dreissena polymorpha]|uniref:Uncharacterized protein n=1 Tax=Dreissena polymorpha TaxID=45954 RepID=A0A9D4HRQ6_DREPO|nr:hypothetical protein DPMN_056668 [Dreissena polymorpha]
MPQGPDPLLTNTDRKRPREQDSDSTPSTVLVQMPEILEQPDPSITQRSRFKTTVHYDAQGENRCTIHNDEHGSVTPPVRR